MIGTNEKVSPILTESIGKLVWRLSLPGIAGMVLLSINTLSDAFFAGRFIHPDALTGITLSLPLVACNIALARCIGVGASSLLSRAIGSGDRILTSSLHTYVLILSILSSLLIAFVGFLFSNDLLTFLGAKNRELEYGAAYYKVICLGSITSLYGMSTSMLIRSSGRIKEAMLIMAVGIFMNLLFNTFFILFFHLGSKGPAYASILSMAVYSFLNSLFLSRKNSPISILPQLSGLQFRLFYKIVAIGSSAMIGQLANVVRQIVLFKTIAIYAIGMELAIFSSIFRIYSFSVLPVFGFVQGLQPVVGINFGAQKFTRVIDALRIFSWNSMALMGIIWLPLFLFPEYIISMLLPEVSLDSETIRNFRILISFIPFFPISSIGFTYLQATEETKTALYLSLGREIVLFLPIILFFSSIYATDGIYYGLLIENIVFCAIMSIAVLTKLKKLKLAF